MIDHEIERLHQHPFFFKIPNGDVFDGLFLGPIFSILGDSRGYNLESFKTWMVLPI